MERTSIILQDDTPMKVGVLEALEWSESAVYVTGNGRRLDIGVWFPPSGGRDGRAGWLVGLELECSSACPCLNVCHCRIALLLLAGLRAYSGAGRGELLVLIWEEASCKGWLLAVV